MSSTEFPFETPPSASLNRVQIMDLPGLPLDAAVHGRRGDELVSNRVLMALAGAHADALGLPMDDLPPVTPQLTRSDVTARDWAPRAVDAALASADPARRAAGAAVARRLGRNLGWLLIALHRGNAANRAVRPDWRPADWQTWAAVRRVWLGGGLSSGRLGETIAAEARQLLQELGYGQIEVALSPYRGQIALVGAARLLNAAPGTRSAVQERCLLGLDFGPRRAQNYAQSQLAAWGFAGRMGSIQDKLIAGQRHTGLAAAQLALQQAIERAPASPGFPQ